MRLSKEEVKAIKEVVGTIDEAANIYLFGSRVHDDKKGGDIDLLILSDILSQEDVSKIKYNLWDIIGEQKIDIIIAKDDTQTFTKIALKESVLL